MKLTCNPIHRLGTLLAMLLCGLPWQAAAQPRHHALIVAVGEYSAASESAPLPGIPKDIQTARRMAQAMGVASERIVELRDQEATKPAIVAALQSLSQRVEPGEKVFVYFSGHGTSYSRGGRCEQGFIPYTAGRHTVDDVLTEAELAAHTSKISQRADKALVMIDACYSGGLGAARTRSIAGSAVSIRAKFVPRSGDQCGMAVNQAALTRSFLPAMQRLGVPEENFVQISAAGANEVSWDNEEYGGLATHSLGQCLLGDARDLDRSGAITLEEVRRCAQSRLDKLMEPHRPAGMLPSTIQVRGSRNLIVVADPPKPPTAPTLALLKPAPMANASPARPIEAALTPPTSPALATLPAPLRIPAESAQEPPLETPAEQLSASSATLQDILSQRNGRLRLEVTAPKRLVIGKDAFSFGVTSATAGYLYVVMLGSDGKSFYLLYPNRLDQDNRIKANTRYQFPRAGWSVKAAGPAGTNQALFVVTQSPRDPRVFGASDEGSGPFAFSLADLTARQRLVDFFVGKGVQGRNGQMAARLVAVEEVQ